MPKVRSDKRRASKKKGKVMETSASSSPVRVGVFRRIADADRAVHDLVVAGFQKDEITVICPTCAPGNFRDYERQEPAGSNAAAAATAGGAIGMLLGGLVAIAGITLSGGVGLLVAGPMLAAAAGGAVTGGFVGAMMTRGLEPEIADFYDQAVQKGNILVAVDCPGDDARQRLAQAERIFAEKGAETLQLTRG
jgi:hypothetical protein